MARDGHAVQRSALEAITTGYLAAYEVETKGVYIQEDVEFPAELVQVLTQREIAKQEKATFEEQQRAQTARVEMEKARGTADMQGQLAQSQVSIEINRNDAEARTAQGQGEASYVELTGRAEAARREAIGLAEAKATEALGLAKAEGFEAQRVAIGETATALVAISSAVSEGHIQVVPDVLVTGGGGSFEGLAASLIGAVRGRNGRGGGPPAAPVDDPVGASADSEPSASAGQTVGAEIVSAIAAIASGELFAAGTQRRLTSVDQRRRARRAAANPQPGQSPGTLGYRHALGIPWRDGSEADLGRVRCPSCVVRAGRHRCRQRRRCPHQADDLPARDAVVDRHRPARRHRAMRAHQHAGFLMEGSLHFEFADGCTLKYVAPAVVDVAPGHDAWVVGDGPAVLIEVDFESTRRSTVSECRPVTVTADPAEAARYSAPPEHQPRADCHTARLPCVLVIERVEVVRHGAEAMSAFAPSSRSAQAESALAPVTVVVPSNFAGLAARHTLGRHGVANVGFVTPFRLAELLSTDLLLDSRPLTNPVLGAAVRAALAEDPGPFAASAPPSRHRSQRRVAVRRGCPAPAPIRAQLRAGGGMPGRAIALVESIADRLGPFHQEADITNAAADRSDLGEAARQLGHLIWFLPSRRH